MQCTFLSGEVSLLFLYTQYAFAWTPVEYSFYFTMNILVHLIGNRVDDC